MNKYILKIDCDILNEMGLSVNRKFCVSAREEPSTGDIYRFQIGHPSQEVTIRVLSIITIDSLNADVLEICCEGEELDNIDNEIKENFEWQTFSIDM